MRFSTDGLKLREKFLTAGLFESLRNTPEGTDPFTSGTGDIPRAFRIGECRELAPERTEFELLLFWRNDDRTEQRLIRVEAAKEGEKWLIDRVSM